MNIKLFALAVDSEEPLHGRIRKQLRNFKMIIIRNILFGQKRSLRQFWNS
jgi:hypothetical protein